MTASLAVSLFTPWDKDDSLANEEEWLSTCMTELFLISAVWLWLVILLSALKHWGGWTCTCEGMGEEETRLELDWGVCWSGAGWDSNRYIGSAVYVWPTHHLSCSHFYNTEWHSRHLLPLAIQPIGITLLNTPGDGYIHKTTKEILLLTHLTSSESDWWILRQFCRNWRNSGVITLTTPICWAVAMLVIA